MFTNNAILYKYRCDSDYTVGIIKNHKVWLSNASELNDAFECSIQDLAKEYIEKKIKEEKQQQIAGFVFAYLQFQKSGNMLFFGKTRKESKHFFKVLKTKKLERKYEMVREFVRSGSDLELSRPGEIYKDFDRQLQEVGIFSMSETADNELMWSHYGDSNKGLVLGFRAVEGSKLLSDTHCIKVHYSDEMPKCESEGFIVSLEIYMEGKNKKRIELNDPTLQCAISNKSTNWEYEKEWRYIEKTSGAYDYPGELCEVIFGLNCPTEVREKYRQLVREYIQNEVRFFEIKKVHNSKRLEIVEL